MILIDLPASARCSHTSGTGETLTACATTSPVDVCLLASGGLGFRMTQNGWQVLVAAPNAPFMARCPQHHQTIGVVEDPSMLQAGPRRVR